MGCKLKEQKTLISDTGVSCVRLLMYVDTMCTRFDYSLNKCNLNTLKTAKDFRKLKSDLQVLIPDRHWEDRLEDWESRIVETDVSEWIPRYVVPHSYHQANCITLLAKMHTYARSRTLAFTQMCFSRSKLLCYKISRTTFKTSVIVQLPSLKACYILPILRICWNATLSCFPLHFPKTYNTSS